MTARKADPIVTEARRRLIAAGQALAAAEREALRELRQVERLLAKHPEAETEGSLAEWLRDVCQSFLRGDFKRHVDGAAILDDVRHARRKMDQMGQIPTA